MHTPHSQPSHIEVEARNGSEPNRFGVEIMRSRVFVNQNAQQNTQQNTAHKNYNVPNALRNAYFPTNQQQPNQYIHAHAPKGRQVLMQERRKRYLEIHDQQQNAQQGKTCVYQDIEHPQGLWNERVGTPKNVAHANHK
jgi:hypothetical protein